MKSWTLLWKKLLELLFGVRNVDEKKYSITVIKSIQETGYKMKSMKLIRKIYTNKSTLGILSIDNFECWILEPPERRNGSDIVCIPSGTYKVIMRWSEKNKMEVPGIEGVPNRTDIEIHPGNYPKDTQGCLLPGKTHQVDFVSDSKETCSVLFPLIKEAIKDGELFINIIG